MTELKNTENTQVMNKEVIELFSGKYCDVSIYNLIMEEQLINFCAVDYDEEESLLIIDKDGVRFELNGNAIDKVDVYDEEDEDVTITIGFSDGTEIIINPLERFEARQRYAHELLMLELIRDRYKKEMFED